MLAMGFFIFAAASIAFSLASVISIVIGVIGVILYVWQGKNSKQARRIFWYSLIGSILFGVIIINLVQLPQAPAGSNYSEWLNEWVIKAVVYALFPGAACLLGGVASIFTQMMVTKDKKFDGH
jgi:hypothetical protein